MAAARFRAALTRGIPHLLVVPVLPLTFLVGPGGLLLYLAIRSFARGRAVSVEENAA